MLWTAGMLDKRNPFRRTRRVVFLNQHSKAKEKRILLSAWEQTSRLNLVLYREQRWLMMTAFYICPRLKRKKEDTVRVLDCSAFPKEGATGKFLYPQAKRALIVHMRVHGVCTSTRHYVFRIFIARKICVFRLRVWSKSVWQFH